MEDKVTISARARAGEGYVVRKVSHDLLFFVDRSKTQKWWWTYNPYYAKVFRTLKEAENKANSLKYGKFQVITTQEMHDLRRQKDEHHESVKKMRSYSFNPDDYEHPHSSEALGQW